MPAANNPSILALDVGDSRIGVAVASRIARIPSPMGAVSNDATVFDRIQELLREHEVDQVVVGYPRNMSGDPTAQTEAVKTFTEALEQHIDVPIVFQDESLTSKKAETELQSRGKPYEKADIDALAATFILEDYLKEAN
jgi:putative holliday junction resolvase